MHHSHTTNANSFNPCVTDHHPPPPGGWVLPPPPGDGWVFEWVGGLAVFFNLFCTFDFFGHSTVPARDFHPQPQVEVTSPCICDPPKERQKMAFVFGTIVDL